MKKSIPCCPLTLKLLPHICLGLFWTVFFLQTVLYLCTFLFWFRPDNFFTGETIFLYIIVFIIYYWFEVKSLLMTDLFLTNMQLLFHKMFIDGLEWCGLLVDYCDVFISCLDSHSDGTHSLQRIHCWASDAMPNFSKSVPMKKQTHLHLGLGKLFL